MTTQYGDVNVQERFSRLLEPNLYGDAVLQPKKTFNDQYQGDKASGLVKIFKTTRDESGDPGTPAGDFSHENAANTLIDLRLNNAFRKSKKIYKIQADAVPYNLAEETLATAVKDNQEDWQYSGLACLAHEGTDIGDYTAITADNIKTKVLAARTALRNAHAKPNTVIASVAVYTVMLSVAGTEYTPTRNDNTLTTGRVGNWMGMTWYEGDLLDKEQARYYNYAGDLITEDLTDVDFFMYDSNTFHIVDNLEAMRVVDATDFVGSYAQNEINTGYRVSNAERVAIKKNAQLDALTLTSVAGSGGAGTTVLTVSPTILSGHTYVYKINASTAPSVEYDQVLTTGWTAWNGTDELTTTADYKIGIAEIDASNKAKKYGSVTAVVASGS